jgi:type VI secretion system protein ImpE
MNSLELFRSGKLDEAVQALGAELRSNPLDAKRRTFLFELLCFAGDYDRAEKHLTVLAESNKQAGLGGLLYRAALHAERLRQQMFTRREWPRYSGEPKAISGTFDGKPFQSISDTDPRIGDNLEVFVAGSYMWIPLEHIAEIQIPAPTKLRDLLWTPALVKTGPTFKGHELGEVLIPVLAPMSSTHADEEVRLGRRTVFEPDQEYGEVPFGQKMLAVDDEEVPILEIRKLTFDVASGESRAAAAS